MYRTVGNVGGIKLLQIGLFCQSFTLQNFTQAKSHEKRLQVTHAVENI